MDDPNNDINSPLDFVIPNWPAPAHIIAGTTTRQGGASNPPFGTLNLASHVDDSSHNVTENREILDKSVRFLQDQPTKTNQKSKARWHWLNQTHSNRVTHIISNTEVDPKSPYDAAVTALPYQACAVLTADCLPILLTDRKGSFVGAIHAGWRGLVNGVIKNTVNMLINTALPTQSKNDKQDWLAWFGPCIRSSQYEVGEDMRTAVINSRLFADTLLDTEKAFNPIVSHSNPPNAPPKYHADIAQLARIALNRAGVHHIYDCGLCTSENSADFFSYRRDGQTGRMASFIYIAPV